MDANIQSFVNAYIECALWVSTDDTDDPLDKNYIPEDISPDSFAKIVEECEQFCRRNKEDIEGGLGYERAGHDFWLTRNHHGDGFWDKDWGWEEEVGDRLTENAQAFDSCYLYVGDDGLIYIF